MLTGKQIKVIKHERRIDSHTVGADKRRPSVRNQFEQSKRDAVTIVTGWISELRQKQAKESARGFQSLFREVG